MTTKEIEMTEVTLPAMPEPEANSDWPEPLTNFSEGQWWVKELDAVAVSGTAEQKRAVAVVHHLLAAALKSQDYAREAVLLERERCAKVAEKVGIQTFMTESFLNQVREARETIAAAIRKGETP